ncbi:serine/threonine-protein kinase [Longispora albida]|uniref:serine/threonine-protein kinase n=1 Tax=Longispora albida TaxID=203523 RepID=UPI000370867A|nr:serine/threonine-protein kinase [Longispora albida]
MKTESWTVPGYREIRELGRGGAGHVVLAQHETTGVQVAIKYLSAELCAQPEFLAGFRSEARLLADLDAPNVVRLYEYLETGAGAAIVMELVDGIALRALLREHGPTTPEAALYVLKGSLLGLAAAHACSVVHRDYKPENVLIDATGASKLADFGISARVGSPGMPAGTPSYMAPEQWHGRPANPQTDIYAATATFFECVTGHKPFRADTMQDMQAAHEQAPIPVDAAPEPIRALIRRGLAKDPNQRPSNATTFLDELEQAAAVYGPGWERRGREELAKRAALLALLFPFAQPTGDGSAVAKTILGPSRNAWLGIGAVVLLIVVTTGVAGFALTSNESIKLPGLTSTNETVLTPDPKPPVPNSAEPSPTPSPTPNPSETPAATAAPTVRVTPPGPGQPPLPDPGPGPVITQGPGPVTPPPGTTPPPASPTPLPPPAVSPYKFGVAWGCRGNYVEARPSGYVQASNAGAFSLKYQILTGTSSSDLVEIGATSGSYSGQTMYAGPAAFAATKQESRLMQFRIIHNGKAIYTSGLVQTSYCEIIS